MRAKRYINNSSRVHLEWKLIRSSVTSNPPAQGQFSVCQYQCCISQTEGLQVLASKCRTSDKSQFRVKQRKCFLNTSGECLLIIPQCLCRLICMWLISVSEGAVCGLLAGTRTPASCTTSRMFWRSNSRHLPPTKNLYVTVFCFPFPFLTS